MLWGNAIVFHTFPIVCLPHISWKYLRSGVWPICCCYSYRMQMKRCESQPKQIKVNGGRSGRVLSLWRDKHLFALLFSMLTSFSILLSLAECESHTFYWIWHTERVCVSLISVCENHVRVPVQFMLRLGLGLCFSSVLALKNEFQNYRSLHMNIFVTLSSLFAYHNNNMPINIFLLRQILTQVLAYEIIMVLISMALAFVCFRFDGNLAGKNCLCASVRFFFKCFIWRINRACTSLNAHQNLATKHDSRN